MTLLDFCRLLKQHFTWIIVVPVISALIAAAVAVVALPAQYSAEATIRSVTSVDIASLGGIAESAAQEVISEKSLDVTSKTNTSTRSVSITAEGTNASEVLDALNSTVSETEENVKTLFGDGTKLLTSVPSSANNVSSSPLKYAAVTFLAALFIVICIIVVVDRIRDPIHSSEEVEAVYEIPLLGTCSSGAAPSSGASHGKNSTRNAERLGGKQNMQQGLSQSLARETLLANILFASDRAESFCVVPVSAADNATQVLKELAKTAQAEHIAAEFKKAHPHARAFDSFVEKAQREGNLAFVLTPAITEGVSPSYAASTVDATVLVLSTMNTTRKEMKETLHQLAIAKANIIGFVNVQQVPAQSKTSNHAAK